MGAGGLGAKQARLTSSPQSVPQLFLMAQKGVAEPRGRAVWSAGRVRDPRVSSQGPRHWALFTCLLWAYWATGTRGRAKSKTGPPTMLPETRSGSRAWRRHPPIHNCSHLPPPWLSHSQREWVILPGPQPEAGGRTSFLRSCDPGWMGVGASGTHGCHSPRAAQRGR